MVTIAHQMQHIYFVETHPLSTLVNLTTHLYFINLDQPTSHFGSTQGLLIAHPNLIEMI